MPHNIYTDTHPKSRPMAETQPLILQNLKNSTLIKKSLPNPKTKSRVLEKDPLGICHSQRTICSKKKKRKFLSKRASQGTLNTQLFI